MKRPKDVGDLKADDLAERFERLRPSELGGGHPGPGARGRPSLGANDEHSPKVQARVTRELYDKLYRRAHAGHTTVSAVLREAIEKL